MDIEKALTLKKSNDIYRAAQEAERRNVEHWIVKKLWENYSNAIEKEGF